MEKVYKAKILDREEIRKQIKKAIALYRETAFRMPDKILLSEVRLPRILKNGKIIDLNEKYKDATFVGTIIGGIIAIPYIAVKGSGRFGFVHFVNAPVYLVVDPEDRKRIYFAFGKLEYKDVGIIG